MRDWRWRKARDVDRDIDGLGAELAVAHDDETGTVVGYVTMHCDRETGIGWIHNLAVAAGARDQGLGRRLIENRAIRHALRLARDKGRKLVPNRNLRSALVFRNRAQLRGHSADSRASALSFLR